MGLKRIRHRSAALAGVWIVLAAFVAPVDWRQVAAAQRPQQVDPNDAPHVEGAEQNAEELDEDGAERRRNRRGAVRRSRGWPFLGIPSWQLKDGDEVHDAFRGVVADAAKSLVCIHCDGKHAILGSVVEPGGWVLTKASVLDGELSVHTARGDQYPAEVVARDSRYDLALLKADGLDSMPPIQLEEIDMPRVGTWLATVGKTARPLAVGVMSVPPRKIPHQPGVLGVQLSDERRPQATEGPLVARVFPDTAAEEAGLQVNDLILRINDKQVANREQLIATVRTYSPGDVVSVFVRRDDEELEFSARLGSGFPMLEGADRDEMQNMLGGELSNRRFGFPTAFQHDTVLRPMDCGGPVVNLDGKVVGFNVARAGRTESYAIDVATVRHLLKQWMSSEATQLVNTGVRNASEQGGTSDADGPPTQRPSPAAEELLVPAQ